MSTTPKKQIGHTAPKAPIISLDQPGRLRVAHLLAILGVSHATLYAGLKPKPGETTTRYPVPDGRDGKLPWWHTNTIRAFLDA
jgi:hypothetical protein